MQKILTLLLFLGLALPAAADEAQDKDLIYRAAFGSTEDIKILLSQGASPFAKNLLGKEVIDIVLERADADQATIVKLLVEAGLDPYAIRANQESVLTDAITRATPETAVYLLNLNPLPSTTANGRGQTIYQLAKARNEPQILAVIEATVAQEQSALQSLTSDERMRELLKELTLSSCSKEYWQYYFSRGHEQNPDINRFDAYMKDFGTKISSSKQNLVKYFKFKDKALTKIETSARKAIVAELDALGTPEFRVRSGLGQEADLQKRCGKISNDLMLRMNIKR